MNAHKFFLLKDKMYPFGFYPVAVFVMKEKPLKRLYCGKPLKKQA